MQAQQVLHKGLGGSQKELVSVQKLGSMHITSLTHNLQSLFFFFFAVTLPFMQQLLHTYLILQRICAQISIG